MRLAGLFGRHHSTAPRPPRVLRAPGAPPIIRDTMNTDTHTNVGYSAIPEAAVRPALSTQVAGVLGFAVLTALSAKVAIPLGFTPVPITLQTGAVLLAGVALGQRLGLLSMLLYLALGTIGLAVFAESKWGFETVLGATGGYLVGFVAAQFAINATLARFDRCPRALLGALLAGHAAIFACGLPWLAMYMGYGVNQTFANGLVPFLPGMLIKTALAFGLGYGVLRLGVRRIFTAR